MVRPAVRAPALTSQMATSRGSKPVWSIVDATIRTSPSAAVSTGIVRSMRATPSEMSRASNRPSGGGAVDHNDIPCLVTSPLMLLDSPMLPWIGTQPPDERDQRLQHVVVVAVRPRRSCPR